MMTAKRREILWDGSVWPTRFGGRNPVLLATGVKKFVLVGHMLAAVLVIILKSFRECNYDLVIALVQIGHAPTTVLVVVAVAAPDGFEYYNLILEDILSATEPESLGKGRKCSSGSCTSPPMEYRRKDIRYWSGVV